MTALDPDFIQRAAPPGSMRYFSLLYTPPEQRESLTALFVVDSEIRATTHVAHEVAHTRLQWWRAEVDRLVNRNAQHPATQVLQAALPDADFSKLHELLVAADMDVARMTYSSTNELDAYLQRSGGILEFATPKSDSTRLGALIRRVETIRDLSFDARAGRVYWPLDELDAKQVSVEQLRSNQPLYSIRALIATEVARLRSEFDALQCASRPLAVLAHLHARLLRRIANANHDVFTQRHQLGSIEKVWTAWRAARRT